jgi:hypothetical protein
LHENAVDTLVGIEVDGLLQEIVVLAGSYQANCGGWHIPVGVARFFERT